MEKKDTTTDAEDPDLCIITHELLTNAQKLLEELQDMVKRCSSIRLRRRRKMEQSVCVATIQKDRETLVIDGFRFEDAASREDLGRLSAREHKTTHD